MAVPGNFAALGTTTIVEGDGEAKRWLRSGSDRISDWLYELVDDVMFYAVERIEIHAPGNIKLLVGYDPAHEVGDRHRFEAVAGVEPDISREGFRGVPASGISPPGALAGEGSAPFGAMSSQSGLGSNPADYPVFVEVGTGIFGPIGQPISTIPGHKMRWIGTHYGGEFGHGGFMFAETVQGQPGQHYTENAHSDTVAATPAKILAALPELGRRD